MKSLMFCSFVVLSAVVGGARSSPPPLQAVPDVDFSRYAGTWYEIARLPNWFQKRCASDVTATYELLDDGDIRVVNRCRKDNGRLIEVEGRAKLAGRGREKSKLKVRFAPRIFSLLPLVWGDYWIIHLAPDYSYAVVGEPSRKYLWILARTPAMDEGTLQSLLERVKESGYDLTGLMRTKHTPAQP